MNERNIVSLIRNGGSFRDGDRTGIGYVPKEVIDAIPKLGYTRNNQTLKDIE